jgi:hypothetical protein
MGSSVIAALRWRGIRVVAHSSLESVALPKQEDQWEVYYQSLKDYYFRRVLADLIQGKRLHPGNLNAMAERWGQQASQKYLLRLQTLGLASRVDEDVVFARPELDNFGETFEWFLAMVLQREFQAEAIWNVRLEGLTGGGDFDVLALMGGTLFYFETKASPPNNVTYAEIKQFLSRQEQLSTDCAMIVNDTTLLIERNILDNLLRAIRLRFHLGKEQALALVQSLSSGVYWVAPKLFVLNVKRDMVTNLERALRFYFAHRVPMFPS